MAVTRERARNRTGTPLMRWLRPYEPCRKRNVMAVLPAREGSEGGLGDVPQGRFNLASLAECFDAA